MLAFQFKERGGSLEKVEVPVPEIEGNDVLIKVKASGVCHSDLFIQHLSPSYPRIPGHEIAGVVEKVGANVTTFKVGDKAAVGWNGGYCSKCSNCREGQFFACETKAVCGMSYNGGYAQYVKAPVSAVAHIPEGLSFEEAAPLMCAGVTTFHALRSSCARPGDVVAILGLGGLGHLAVQFARNMGFVTVSIARGTAKKAQALKIGAHYYIDSTQEDVAEALQKLGGAKVVIATVTKASAMVPCIGGIHPNGELVLCGLDEKLEIPMLPLISNKIKIVGHYSGINVDSEDCMKFAQKFNVRSINEYYPLEDAAKAVKAMSEGKVNLRAILKV